MWCSDQLLDAGELDESGGAADEEFVLGVGLPALPGVRARVGEPDLRSTGQESGQESAGCVCAAGVATASAGIAPAAGSAAAEATADYEVPGSQLGRTPSPQI